ncbi:hypothetical protein LshimejAT787_1002770 [Lyophyllum shimeji]|uniref:Uncharacterized protein n=1 Tax=Lyophyllum shimeji TaxID=47721 RepID=A0A9P3PRZ9_LYOSH|nr:hypothetical protein LshimejAT787_1002770 [Lyophyllum shimeji]
MRPVPREGEPSTIHQSPPSRAVMASPPPQFEPEGTPRHTTPSVPSPSARIEEESDKESLSSLSSPGEVAQTAAEKAREKKLRDDPMAIVRGPLYVDCRRCGTRIKLSSKSLYDPCHWRTHRSRCLKRRPAAPQKQTPKAEIFSPPESSRRPAERGTPPFATDHPARTSELQVLQRDRPSSPLTPCSSPSPTPSTADMIFEEYVLRSHGKKLSPPTSSHWRDWSWSQLLHPRFTTLRDLRADDDNNDNNFYMNDADSRLDDSISGAVF